MIIENVSVYNWRINILYKTICDDCDFIIKTLMDIKCPVKYINKALDNLQECKLNSGLTYSNTRLKSSVIIINKTSSFSQLINTIAHEYFHLICHISDVLEIKDEEKLANLNGNLNMRSYNIIEDLRNR